MVPSRREGHENALPIPTVRQRRGRAVLSKSGRLGGAPLGDGTKEMGRAEGTKRSDSGPFFRGATGVTPNRSSLRGRHDHQRHQGRGASIFRQGVRWQAVCAPNLGDGLCRCVLFVLLKLLLGVADVLPLARLPVALTFDGRVFEFSLESSELAAGEENPEAHGNCVVLHFLSTIPFPPLSVFSKCCLLGVASLYIMVMGTGATLLLAGFSIECGYRLRVRVAAVGVWWQLF